MSIPEDNNNYNKQLHPLATALRKNMTKAEACLWKYALRAGMMKDYTFKKQRPILNYIADFICIELKLIIEVDGLTHSFTEVQLKDEQKRKDLESSGFTVMRFTDSEVLNNMDGVFQFIYNWIEEFEKRSK
jgi:very-short-patch-repair endonuclease